MREAAYVFHGITRDGQPAGGVDGAILVSP